MSSSCSNDSTAYNFNSQEIQLLLDLTNDYRNGICNGSVNGYAPCARMAKVVGIDRFFSLESIENSFLILSAWVQIMLHIHMCISL